MKDQLFSAVLGDVMDTIDLRHQFLSPRIQAIDPNMVIAGRAMPVKEADIGDSVIEEKSLKDKDFGMMFEALDSLQENDVYICTGSSPTYALWGEMMSTRAKHLNASGAVLDGYHRDSTGVLHVGLPCFSYGAYAQDQGVRGKVVDYNCPIVMNGIKISPGDIVFGDRDGVLIIPKGSEEEVIQLAYKKATTENKLKLAIENGMSTVDAYAKFGVM
jgi:regulator of RNase E activity RraA